MSIADLAESRKRNQDRDIIPNTTPLPVRQPIIVPVYHYERQTDNYKAGDILHNFNGSDYLLVERYRGDRCLVKNIDSGMYIVASGLHKYIRYPVDEPDKKQYGIEWDSGTYLSSRKVDVDRDYLREQFGEYTPPKVTVMYKPPSRSTEKSGMSR